MLPPLTDLTEPVVIPYSMVSSNFTDLMLWEPKRAPGLLDFKEGDRLYAVDSVGVVRGRIVRLKPNKVTLYFAPEIGPVWAALLHMYGDNPATGPKDGPIEGEEVWLRWSGIPGFGFLPTEAPIIFKRATTVQVFPNLDAVEV